MVPIEPTKIRSPSARHNRPSTHCVLLIFSSTVSLGSPAATSLVLYMLLPYSSRSDFTDC